MVPSQDRDIGPASTKPVPPAPRPCECCGKIAYLIGPKKVEWTPIAKTAASISGMLASMMPRAADDHDADLGELDDPDQPRLVVVVGKLAGQRREQEEGQDEERLARSR